MENGSCENSGIKYFGFYGFRTLVGLYISINNHSKDENKSTTGEVPDLIT
jgi:hypothetical protein